MKLVRLQIISLTLLFWTGVTLAVAAPDQARLADLFSQANSEYQKGDFSAAEKSYVRILESGVESVPLYYNLGNACFKQKRLGEAVYYWEKALQKSPGDREARENLELANLLIVDRLELPADPLPLRLLKGAMGILTVTQEEWLALGLFLAANILFFIYLLGKGRLSYRALIGALVIGLLFIPTGSSLAWKTYDRDFRKKGIVIEQKVDVRSGPGSENITVFTIHEGLKVRVHGSSNGWVQISLPNGWTGWLRRNCIRIL